jgi:leucyl aminopeptidase
VFAGRKLSAVAQALDRASRGQLSAILRRGELEGRAGTSLLLQNVPRLSSPRVLLVGLGAEKEFGARAYLEAVQTAFGALAATPAAEAVVTLPELAVKERDTAWAVRQATLAAAGRAYRFVQMKSKSPGPPPALRRVTLTVAKGDVRAATAAARQARAVADGMALARDLGNLPGNVCTPTYLADTARALARTHKLAVKVLEKRDMEKLGMGTFLSVARGSHEPPKFIVLEYNGGARGAQPVVLVGKGITFDTGGISLKPAPEMDEMKYDMSGAGSVLGTLKAVAELKLPLNVVGIVVATENMPGGSATKPGDIVKTMSGQTVEILNTDAEGRLVLCDALTYAERYKPAAVVDIATLTGACVIALGHVASGLYANNEALAEEITAAGQASHDRVWRMPLWEDYQEQLRSNFADFANIGGRPAGSVTAACYLARFAGKFKWAHLDIAGTAWRSGKDKGSTGRPVPLLTQFLIDRAAKQ